MVVDGVIEGGVSLSRQEGEHERDEVDDGVRLCECLGRCRRGRGCTCLVISKGVGTKVGVTVGVGGDGRMEGKLEGTELLRETLNITGLVVTSALIGGGW